MTVNECAWCRKHLEQPTTGRPRLYCSASHRCKAWRERKWYAEVERIMETTSATLPPHARADADELPALDLMLLLI